MRPPGRFASRLGVRDLGAFSLGGLACGLPGRQATTRQGRFSSGVMVPLVVPIRSLKFRGREWDPPDLFEVVAAVDANLVQLEQAADGPRIPLAGQIEQPPALIHLLFFGMARCSTFHARLFFPLPLPNKAPPLLRGDAGL